MKRKPIGKLYLDCVAIAKARLKAKRRMTIAEAETGAYADAVGLADLTVSQALDKIGQTNRLTLY